MAGNADAGVTVRKGTFTAMVAVQSLGYIAAFGAPPPPSVPVISDVIRLFYNQQPQISMDVTVPLSQAYCSPTDRYAYLFVRREWTAQASHVLRIKWCFETVL